MTSFNHARISLLIVGAICTCGCSGAAYGEGEPSAGADTARAPVELTCAASEEQLIDLGSLEPDVRYASSSAAALNEHGTVVGYSNKRVSPVLISIRAFRWKAATGMVELGTLGGDMSYATDVNEWEQVAGTAQLPDENLHAVVWDAQGHIRDLGTLGGRGSFAYNINNRGQVVGVSDDASGKLRPFIWEATTGMVDLGLPQTDFAYLSGINDFGVVVGTWVKSDDLAVPFKWTKQDGPSELDLLGGTLGEASAINNLEEIVGYVVVGNEGFGVKWTSCGAWRLARLPNRVQSFPEAINDRGLIVGHDSTDIQYVAVEWESTNRIAPLPLESNPSYANDVDNCGDVVGSRQMGNVSQAYLWHPKRQSQ